MSTSNSERQNRTDPRPNYIFLGTDDEGADHVWRVHADVVIVVDDTERIHVEQLAPKHVDDWIAYVGMRRGWETRRYYESLGQWFGDL